MQRTGTVLGDVAKDLAANRAETGCVCDARVRARIVCVAILVSIVWVWRVGWWLRFWRRGWCWVPRI